MPDNSVAVVCVTLQEAAVTTPVPCRPCALARHGRSKGIAESTGQVCCRKVAGTAAETGLAAVEASSQTSTSSSPAAVRQNGV